MGLPLATTESLTRTETEVLATQAASSIEIVRGYSKYGIRGVATDTLQSNFEMPHGKTRQIHHV